ncbi:MAG: cohesin domain-containing protein [Bacteroidota bacterium]
MQPRKNNGRDRILLRIWARLQKMLLLFGLLLAGLYADAQTIYLGNDPSTGPQCNCLNNATTLTDGQFLDTLTINSGVTGETWTLTAASTGAFASTSAAPPTAPTSAVGATFTEVATGIYRLLIRHVDAEGFVVTANNGTTDLVVGNTCFYPNVSITGLPDTVCLTSAPVALTADNSGAAGNGQFTVNGQVTNVFSAQNEGPGTHTVTYTFDAGTATANDASDPGCITQVSQQVIVPNPPTIGVVALVNVTLGTDCTAEVTSEMMMAGDYPCMDDFIITVFDQNGLPIGNMVNGTHAGERLNVRVMSEAGAFVGDGQIDVFDVTAPTITCPPGNNMPNYDNEVQLLPGNIPANATTFTPSNFSCYNSIVAHMSGTNYYTIQEITVTETDVYTIELSGAMAGGAVFGIYQGTFGMFQGPCQNLVGVSEPLPAGEGYYTTVSDATRLHVMLMPGIPYTILTTTFNGNLIGDYEYAFYSENDGEITGLASSMTSISLPIYCTSVPDLINNQASVELLGAPIVNDACMLNPTVTFTDQFTNGGNCGVSTITRTFTVTDQSGNSDQCVQTIDFFPISLEEVNLPPLTINISCDMTFVPDDNGNPSPEMTGYPFIITAGGTFNIDPAYCNMLATYEDRPRMQVCAGTEQFVREWVIFDDCDPGNLIEFDQLIIIGDRTPPVLTCSAADTLRYGTQGNICSAVIEVPIPTVTDNCSNFMLSTEVIINQQVAITNPFGQVTGFQTQSTVLATIAGGMSRIVSNIPVGNHFFRHTATDACGNSATIECPFTVNDFALPTAACDDLINVSLGGNGLGVLAATDVDEGSNDNCGPVTLEVRRTLNFAPDDCSPTAPVTTDWGPTVNLYCCEAGDTIAVELLVTDVVGNINTCSSEVVIVDNTAPLCLAPQPVSTSCVDQPPGTDFTSTSVLQNLFGMAQVADICDGSTVEELTPQVTMQNCGLGEIIRTFQVADPSGNTSTCQQVITLTTNSNYEIKFPKDVIGNCEEPGADTLIVNNFGCDDFAINSFDERYEVVDNSACYKILRKYTIINWCEYDGFSPPTLINRNPSCADSGGTEDFWLVRPTSGPAFIDSDNDPTNNTPAAGTRGLACDGQSNPSGYWFTQQPTGYYEYTQIIKVMATTTPTVTLENPAPFCTTGPVCETTVSLNVTVTEGCTGAGVASITAVADVNNTGQFSTPVQLTGSYPNYTVSGTFPLGNHRVRVTTDDECAGPVSSIMDFSVVDCQAPGLICNTAMSITLMQQPPNVDADGDGDFDEGALAINVALFINAVGDDCTEPLRYTIHRTQAVLDGSDVPFPNHPALVVTCDDIGVIPVQIYVWDSAFNPTAAQPDGTVGGPNYYICESLLFVQDNNGVCGNGLPTSAMGMVSGIIMTEGGVPVSGVGVSPRDDMMSEMTMTEDNGIFDFELATDENYTITPYSQEDYLNGVSTFDIIYITKHILGVDPLDSPYQIIAADVNHSNSVTTLDLIHLRKVILNISSAFPNNTSWRFIDAGHLFANTNNPWATPFAETLEISALNDTPQNADFIAVKIGDVNGSAQANLHDAGEGRAAVDAETYYLRTDDTAFGAGEIFEATFVAAAEMDEVQGFQFTLQFDPSVLRLEQIDWGHLQADHVNDQLAERGILVISWNASPQGEEKQSEHSFFTLRFQAQTEGRLSEVLGVTSQQLRAEAYDWDDSLRPVALNFTPRQSDGGEEFYLEQNRPNPFGDQTIIGFQIPNASEVTLTIYDTHGKVMRVYRQHFAAGYNQLLVDAADIAARGLLYYQLETEEYAATRKMVILE